MKKKLIQNISYLDVNKFINHIFVAAWIKKNIKK